MHQRPILPPNGFTYVRISGYFDTVSITEISPAFLDAVLNETTVSHFSALSWGKD